MRRVIGEAVLEDLARTLTAGDIELEGNWNRRFRRNRDKIKTGDVFEIAEVIRHLAVRDRGRGLSSGERQLYAQAKRMLASEVQYARGTDEDEALTGSTACSRARPTCRSPRQRTSNSVQGRPIGRIR